MINTWYFELSKHEEIYKMQQAPQQRDLMQDLNTIIGAFAGFNLLRGLYLLVFPGKNQNNNTMDYGVGSYFLNAFKLFNEAGKLQNQIKMRMSTPTPPIARPTPFK